MKKILILFLTFSMILSIPSARSDDNTNNSDYTSAYTVRHSYRHHDESLNAIAAYFVTLPIATVAISAIIDKWNEIMVFCQNEIHKIENSDKDNK